MHNVIDFGAFQIRKTNSKTYFERNGKCQHKHLETDSNGQTVQCTDCKVFVSAFWALEWIANEWAEMQQGLKTQQESHRQKVESEIHLVAAKNAEKAWRSKTMIPTCPHCKRGISAQDPFRDNTNGQARTYR